MTIELDKSAIDIASDELYAKWRRLWPDSDPDCGPPTTRETWCAAWNAAIDTVILALNESQDAASERGRMKLQ